MAEAAVTLCKNKKIAILALTQTLILTQTWNPNDNIKKQKRVPVMVNEQMSIYSVFALLFSSWALCNVILATSFINIRC